MQNPLQVPLQKLEATIQAIRPQLVHALGAEGLKFVDDNFRLQGYQGRTFIPWRIQKRPDKPRPHKVLILTATLRRSFIQTDSADSSRISTDIPYARVHNEGSSGTAAYSRSRLGTFGPSRPYNQNIPQRQFLPITATDSPILTQRCEAVIIKKITAALPK
jgi:phage gpG-like protein